MEFDLSTLFPNGCVLCGALFWAGIILARIFYRGGMAAVELRRNSVRGINKPQYPFPPYRG